MNAIPNICMSYGFTILQENKSLLLRKLELLKEQNLLILVIHPLLLSWDPHALKTTLIW